MQFDGHLLFNFNNDKKKKIKKCFFQKWKKKERKEGKETDDYRDLVKRWWKVAFRIFTTSIVYVPLDLTNH